MYICILLYFNIQEYLCCLKAHLPLTPAAWHRIVYIVSFFIYPSIEQLSLFFSLSVCLSVCPYNNRHPPTKPIN